MSRAGTRIGLAALLIIAGSKATHNAIANGDTRTISFHHLHTGEDLTITYKRNGRYDDAALKKIDWLMRDWRQNQDIRMDPHLIDLVWEVHRDVGSKSAIQVVCGYRAPVTNTMLRRRSSGVAQQSQHTVGKAIDFLIPDAKLDDLRAAGLRLQRGGVGFYPGSGWPFVHMDVGSVRHWPRMTHDQLARVFPDGRTVHVPSDGQPLKGYALALADLEKRGGTPSATSLEAARTAGVNTEKRTTLATLFGFGKKSDRDEDEEADIPARAPQAVAAAAPRLHPRPAARISLPGMLGRSLPRSPRNRRRPRRNPCRPPRRCRCRRSRPAAPVQTAAVAPVQPARPAQQGSLYSLAGARPRHAERRHQFARLLEGPAGSADRDLGRAPHRDRVGRSAGRRRRREASGRRPAASVRGRRTCRATSQSASRSATEPQAEPRPARAAPIGAVTSNAIPRNTAAAAGTTVALKATPQRPSEIQTALPASLPVTGRAADEPWLRAIIATPSVRALHDHHVARRQRYARAAAAAAQAVSRAGDDILD